MDNIIEAFQMGLGFLGAIFSVVLAFIGICIAIGLVIGILGFIAEHSVSGLIISFLSFIGGIFRSVFGLIISFFEFIGGIFDKKE